MQVLSTIWSLKTGLMQRLKTSHAVKKLMHAAFCWCMYSKLFFFLKKCMQDTIRCKEIIHAYFRICNIKVCNKQAHAWKVMQSESLKHHAPILQADTSIILANACMHAHNWCMSVLNWCMHAYIWCTHATSWCIQLCIKTLIILIDFYFMHICMHALNLCIQLWPSNWP